MKQFHPVAGASSAHRPATTSGWFRDRWQRLFGERDAVEAQLRDIARQGAFGAHVSHFFATLLIILFSTASLIALGADSLRAVLASLERGTVDIPNAVATGVTALLVPAMDVAMLRAASKIRILATRRATRSEMALHVGVLTVISVIEASTYIYMAGIYEHPVGPVAWALIGARAVTAPLIGVYLAMDRPHPVTSRDILAQVELGAGAGVIRDVTEIANDPSANLARKMELFGASAIMRDDEQRRLNDLIAVAGKHETGSAPALPAARIVAASYQAPDTQPPQEHVVTANNMMHDWEIPDEVEGADGYDDDDPGITAVYHADELEEEAYRSATSRPRKGVRTAVNSGPVKKTSARSEAISKGMKRSHKERKAEGKERRQRTVEADVYTILDEWYASGSPKGLTDGQLADRVFRLGHLIVKPSENNVSRYRAKWEITRKREAAQQQPEPELAGVLP